MYFPELLKQYKCTIIEHIGEIPTLIGIEGEDNKNNIVESVFCRLNNKSHPVRNNLFFMKNIKEISIIEGNKK